MTREGAHDPRAIANRILDVCEAKGIRVTLMQLIKLVYLADGWSLALRNEPLSKHSPQAWQYGPVYPTVYKAFKKFGSGAIKEHATDSATGVEFAESFSDDEIALIEQVVDSYGRMHAFRLSEIMHRAGTPWTKTVSESGHYAEIPLGIIAEHFKGLRDQRHVAAR
jgi:uncharacterized phage-associated protein